MESLPASPHRASFARFLQREVAPARRADVGLQAVLRAQFPVRSDDGLASLEFVSYEVLRPKYDVAECLHRGMTWAAPLKVTVRLVLWERDGDRTVLRDVKEQEVFFGEVPLLTDRDLFVSVGVERAALLALQHPADAGGRWRVAGAGEHLAEAAAAGLAATLATTRKRMARAAAMGGPETLMPYELLHARPMFRAFVRLLERSPRVVVLDDTNPLARAAHGWAVALDDDARAALEGSPCARWLTPSRVGLAALSPDAPLLDDGTLDDAAAGGDVRSLAARLAPDADALLRALPLAEATRPPTEAPLARAVAARGGALVLAARAGTVHRVSADRVWTLDDGAAEPTCYALAGSSAPRVVTALSLRPTVAPGARVAEGDALAEGGAAAAGTLALGRRCAVTHRPELAPGTCRVSTGGARALRSLHRTRVDVWVRDTRLGCQELTRDVPGATQHALRHLDASGVAALGASVAPGDVLAGRVTPAAAGAMVDDTARATAHATVVGVEAFARRGRERDARHTAIVDAMKDDLRAALEERLACLAALGAPEGDARERAEERLYLLDRGDDLPPGVLSIVRVELLEEREVACGDALADGRGGRWVVTEVSDDVAAEVELPGDGAPGEAYLMKLRPEPPAKKATRRASGERASARR